MMFKVKVYKNSSFRDKRGYYWTSWKKGLIKNLEFKHDKFSLSKKNVLRGLHGDKKTWKLISCPYGKFFLVVVNCVKNSNFLIKLLIIVESILNILWYSFTKTFKSRKF